MAIVRPEQPGDETAIAAILQATFNDGSEAGLVERLRGSESWVPELSIVVQQEEQLVAYALLSRITAGEANALALGPVAVLPDHQGGRLGSALVRMALDRARSLDFDCAIAIGPPRFLESCGFEPAAAHGVTSEMRLPRDAFRISALKAGGMPKGPVFWPDEWSSD